MGHNGGEDGDKKQQAGRTQGHRPDAGQIGGQVGEEGVETAIAAATGDKNGFRYEAADLLYHLLVACISIGVPFNEVLTELASRHKEDNKK